MSESATPPAGGGPAPGTPGGPPVSERMQALLSRAVEDQLSEQRQLASLVAEVRALMAALPAEVSAAAPVDQSVRSEVAQLRAALGGIEQRLAVLTAAAERPTDHSPVTGVVNAVGSRVDGLGSTLAEVKAAQAGLQAKLDELSTAVSALARSQAETEQRVIAHVDEAVLALAEVLVRRGKPSARPAAPVTVLAAAAPVVAAAPVLATPPLAAAEVVLVPVVDDETAEVERHLAEDAPDDDSDDAAHSTGDAAEFVPPVTAAEDDDADEDEDEDEDDAEDDADDDDADEDEDEDDDAEDDEVVPELPTAPPVEASTWGRGLGQTVPVVAATADGAPPPPPAPAADPWVVPSPFQPGPRRERGDSGAAAALAELQDDDADEPESSDSEDRPRRRPWWRPGD